MSSSPTPVPHSSSNSKSPSASPSDSLVVPSANERAINIAQTERAIASKWDACVENALVKSSTGALAAGLVSLLLFRSPTARCAIIGAGGGLGLGIGWEQCKQTFVPSSRQPPQLSKLQLPLISVDGSTSGKSEASADKART